MTQPEKSGATVPESPLSENNNFFHRLWRTLIGAPRGLADQSLFHRLALIPFLGPDLLG